MAPLPPESTGRVWIDYRTGGGVTSQEHTVMMRYSVPLGGDFTGALITLGLYLTAPGAGSYFDGWQAVSARYAEPSQTFSLPAPLPAGLVGFVGSGQPTASRADQARETTIVGRDPQLARRVRYSVFGLINSLFTDQDFRIARVEGNIVDDWLDLIDESGPAYWVSIAGVVATFNSYANWQYNSYWERELRT